MGWKILIVEDEDPAREELIHLISENKDVSLIEQAKTGIEAIKKAKEIKPDFILLDIELPDLNGIQVAELLTELELPSKIIFATAYDHYAIEAFKVRAFHYILKPYNEEDINDLFEELKKQPNKVTSDRNRSASPFKLAIDIEGGIKYIAPIEIVFISKEGKFVHVHMKKNHFPAQYTLHELQGKLVDYGFFRCHKSYLVSLEHVLEMHPWVHGAFNLKMNDDEQSIVPVSRNYVKDLRLKLEI